MTTTPLDLAALEALATAATPGPWFFAYTGICSKPLSRAYDAAEQLIPADAPDDDPRWGALPEPVIATVKPSYGDTVTGRRVADAEHIAAFSPDVVLALIAAARAGEELRALVVEYFERLDVSRMTNAWPHECKLARFAEAALRAAVEVSR